MLSVSVSVSVSCVLAEEGLVAVRNLMRRRHSHQWMKV
jgi:hypothetical protein